MFQWLKSDLLAIRVSVIITGFIMYLLTQKAVKIIGKAISHVVSNKMINKTLVIPFVRDIYFKLKQYIVGLFAFIIVLTWLWLLTWFVNPWIILISDISIFILFIVFLKYMGAISDKVFMDYKIDKKVGVKYKDLEELLDILDIEREE